MSDTEKIVTTLNAGWYNYVTAAMGITDPRFQLVQGILGLQTADSSGLFRIGDAVPPDAAVSYFDPNGLSRRSSAFQLLLNALLPETGSDLRDTLKDQYDAWITYRDAFYKANPTSSLTQLQIFTQWANQRLDPRLAATAIAVFKEAANTLLNQALDALHNPANQQTFRDSADAQYTLPIYSGTASGAQTAVNTGGPVTLAFDSQTMDSTLKHKTAQGSASGFYEIFAGEGEASFEQLNEKASSQRITIEGTIDRFGTLTTAPGAWFTSGEYTRAYSAPNDARVWDRNANAGDWDSFFAPSQGSLARRVSQLFLVSGYTITVTSHATYSQDDLQKIQKEAGFGIWPFFAAEGSSTQTTEYTLNQESNLVVKHTLDKGVIQIWGVIVQDAPS